MPTNCIKMESFAHPHQRSGLFDFAVLRILFELSRILHYRILDVSFSAFKCFAFKFRLSFSLLSEDTFQPIIFLHFDVQ